MRIITKYYKILRTASVAAVILLYSAQLHAQPAKIPFEMHGAHRYIKVQTKNSDSLNFGMREAISMIPVGSKWMLYIPASLAFGERGGYGEVPAGAAVVCELEVVNAVVQ